MGDGTILGLTYVEITVPGNAPVTDSGFRPSKDGFKFVNDGSIPGPTWEMFEQYFGADAVKYPNGDRIHAADIYFQAKYELIGGASGACDGFTAASNMNYQKLNQSSAGQFAMSQYAPLISQGRNQDTDEAIAFNQAVQTGLEFWGHHDALALNVNNSPAAMYRYAKSLLQNNIPVMGFIITEKRFCASWPSSDTCLKSMGHSLMPYRYEDVNSKKAYLYVYDPNSPKDDNQKIEFNLDPSVDTWTYRWPVRFSLDIPLTGDASYLGISFAPVELYTHQGLPPWQEKPPVLRDDLPPLQHRLYSVSGSLQALFVDDEGRRLGIEGDTLYDEIPGASFLPNLFEFDDGTEGAFYLPADLLTDLTVFSPQSGQGAVRSSPVATCSLSQRQTLPRGRRSRSMPRMKATG